MPITDLTGTKWEFNSTVDISSPFVVGVNFQSNNKDYIQMCVARYPSNEPMAIPRNIIYNTGTGSIYDQDYPYIGEDWDETPGHWTDEAYRTISITSGTGATDATFISWLQANATQIVEPAITDLTGTKWQIKKPSEFVAVGYQEGDYSRVTSVDLVYKIYTGNYESAEQSNLRISQYFDTSTGSFGGCLIATVSPFVYPRFGIICSSSNRSYVQYQVASDDTLDLGDIETTIEITGGTDTTNSDLISWLQSNATQIQDEPTTTFSIGNIPVTNMYVGTRQVRKIYIGNVLVWEKEIEPVPDNALLVQDGKLFTSGGGYLITTEVTMITFYIYGDTYQAEEGMTWGQWIASEYNTAGFTETNFGLRGPNGEFVKDSNNNDVTASDEIVANAMYHSGGSAD